MTIDVPAPAPFPRGMAALDPDPDAPDHSGARLLIPLLRADAALHAYERGYRHSRLLRITLRISRGVTDHFSRRVGEWFATLLLLQFGFILYAPEPVFPHSPNFAVMATMATEEEWGALCLIIGAAHFVALSVNGTFPRFPYSPHVRALASFLACFLWAQITFAILMSGVGGTGLGTYRLVLLLEFYNLTVACLDIGRSKERRKRYGR